MFLSQVPILIFAEKRGMRYPKVLPFLLVPPIPHPFPMNFSFGFAGMRSFLYWHVKPFWPLLDSSPAQWKNRDIYTEHWDRDFDHDDWPKRFAKNRGPVSFLAKRIWAGHRVGWVKRRFEPVLWRRRLQYFCSVWGGRHFRNPVIRPYIMDNRFPVVTVCKNLPQSLILGDDSI